MNASLSILLLFALVMLVFSYVDSKRPERPKKPGQS